MPVIKIDMWEGRPKEKKKELIEKLTETACRVLGCPPNAVTIIIEDVKKENWGQDGKPAGE